MNPLTLIQSHIANVKRLAEGATKNWKLPKRLQRPDWEPNRPSGCVSFAYGDVHGMTCADAQLVAASQPGWARDVECLRIAVAYIEARQCVCSPFLKASRKCNRCQALASIAQLLQKP